MNMGAAAAYVLELTFGFRRVNDVPFTNAAAYLAGTGIEFFNYR